tara:strand:- start:716 stop:1324 length:609 start_codon:yes stop_codon:yes gene_type:complete
MQRSFKVHELWPTPLYENHINVKPEWVNKSKNFEYERMYSDNGDYTKNKEILNELPDLKEEIYKNVILFTEKYLNTADVHFYFTNSWVVKHHPNDWAQAHNHTNSLLSGVYYLETEKDSGDISFESTNNNVFPNAVSPNCKEYNYTTGTQIKMSVDMGKLFIFPSHLLHRVLKNKTNKIRYSLAFNLFCKGNFGRDEFELKL